jgi:glutathione S-transferase
MPKVLYASASPYSVKVLMAAHYAGIPVEAVSVNANEEPQELLALNPLGKIPTFVTDDGKAIFDSRVITQYLNRISGNKLFPRNAEKRLEAEQLESLADGLCDALLAHVYERRFHPEEKIHQPWLDRQWGKAVRALDLLEAAPPRLSAKLNAGHIALAAALGYLGLRFEGQWEKGRPKLKRWLKRFGELHPELAEKLPK